MTASATTTNPRTGLTTSELAVTLGLDLSPSPIVELDLRQVQRVAEHIASRSNSRAFAPATWDDPLFWNVHDPPGMRSQLFALGNAINFRFWRLEINGVIPITGVVEGREYRGAMYMWRSLRRAIDRADFPILDAEFLSNLSAETFDAIFSDDRGINPLSIAQDERIANIRDLGRALISRWSGSFYNVVRASGDSLVKFTRLSRAFRAYDDPLLKLTMVNTIMHSGSGVYRFADDPLPAIDYHLLRHALRQAMLRPRADVARKLTQNRLLKPYESYELRRTALSAFVELSKRTGLSGDVLDNMYWLNRTNCSTEPVCLRQETAHQCPFLDACARDTAYALPLELTRYC